MSAAPRAGVSLRQAILWALGAVVCFHLAYEFDTLRGLIVGFLFCLVPLARLETNRKAFYVGLGLGLAIYAPQLVFFWTIFNAAAIALWCVLAFWMGVFLVLSRQAMVRFGQRGLWAIPILWLGVEFFRSELYYLRFSWLTPGLALSGTQLANLLGFLGVYGVGCLLFAIAAGAWTLRLKPRALLIAVAIAGVSLLGGNTPPVQPAEGAQVQIAGVQLEFPTEDQLLAALQKLATTQTNASILVLSEYTFTGPVPQKVRDWCREAGKYLIVGAHDPAGEDYFNTAFVIGPTGETVAKQAKSVPIQFFKDGLPAREQKVWASPWGRIGMGVCYDLSYRRVADGLAAQQCQALVIPTMDVAEWGERQHRLHGRIAPMRAAELGVPIFRLCSSGISQAVERSGAVTASAPFPGEGSVLAARMTLNRSARTPMDHWLGPLASGATGIFAVALIFLSRKKTAAPQPPMNNAAQT
jgi:apolipoprotein N-acyltransferase